MLRGQRAKAAERLRTSQDAVRVVGVQADLLPLAFGQRSRFAPDPGGDADAANVVQQARPAQRGHVHLHQSPTPAGAAASAATPGEWPSV